MPEIIVKDNGLPFDFGKQNYLCARHEGDYYCL